MRFVTCLLCVTPKLCFSGVLYVTPKLCFSGVLYVTPKLCFIGVLVAAVPMTDCNWSSGLRAGRWLCPLWPQCAKWVWPYGRSSRSSTPTFWRSTPSFDGSANKVRTCCRNVPSVVDCTFRC